jgi:hypothetical protein
MAVGDFILLRAAIREILTGYWKLSSFKNVPYILLDTVLSKGKFVPVLNYVSTTPGRRNIQIHVFLTTALVACEW